MQIKIDIFIILGSDEEATVIKMSSIAEKPQCIKKLKSTAAPLSINT